MISMLLHRLNARLCFAWCLLVILPLDLAWAGTGQLEVRVVDSASGRALAGAAIRLSTSTATLSARTDEQGRALLEGLESGLYSIEVRMSGYQSMAGSELSIADDQASRLDIPLVSAAQVTEEVIVTGTIIGADPLSSVGTSYIDREALRSAAGSGSDVMRSLDGLPGLFADGEYSSFTVRGNGPRDNLILVDGIPFDNVVHFSDSFGAQEDIEGGGRYSVFAPNVVAGAEFQPGGWGAAYSGRSGSLLKLQVAEGNRDTAAYSARLDISGLEVGYDGPSRFHSDTSLLLSARRLNFGRVFDLIGLDDIGTPKLTDIIFKSSTQLNDNNKLNILTIYAPEEYVRDINNVLASDAQGDGSFDNVSLIQSKADNLLLGTTWSRFFTGGSELVNRLYYRAYHERTRTGEAYPDWVPIGSPVEEIPVRDNILRTEREERVIGLHTDFYTDTALGRLSTGLRVTQSKFAFDLYLAEDWIRYSYNQTDFRPDPEQRYIVLTPEFVNNQYQETAVNYAAYADQEVSLGDWLMRFGLRYDRDNFSEEGLLSPRVGITWFASDDLRLTSTAGRYYQSPRTNDRASDAGNAQLKNEVVDQVSLGFAWLLAPKVELFVEPYYQDWNRIVVKQDGVSQRFSNTGEGHSRGVDTAITRQFYRGWSADFKYSYNEASIRNRPGGDRYFADFNRPHSLSFGGVWELNSRWKLSARWKWASGKPQDAFVVHQNVLGEEEPLRFSKEITDFNVGRYPSFNSLNLRADYRRAVAAVDLIAFIDVLNVLGSPNPSSSSFNERTGLVAVEEGAAFPLVGIRLEW